MSVPGELIPQTDSALPTMEAGMAEVDPEAAEAATREEKRKLKARIEKFTKEFKQADKFDEVYRKQFRVDRSYASSRALLAWAVSTNILQSTIDVLVATLYARDPDVSVRKAPRVDKGLVVEPPIDPLAALAGGAGMPLPGDPPLPGAMPPAPPAVPDPMMAPGDPTQMPLAAGAPPTPLPVPPPSGEMSDGDLEAFAKTLELVVSRLWANAKMKKRMRKVMRSVLTVGQGWLKVLPIGQKKPDPQIRSQLNSLEDNVRRVQALRAQIAAGTTPGGNTASEDDLAAQQAQLETTMAGLQGSLERMVYEGLAIDYVRPDDIQVSTDVETLEDYEDASIIWHKLYYPKDEILERVPLLEKRVAEGSDPGAALAGVLTYYRKVPRVTNDANGNAAANAVSAMDAALSPDQVTEVAGYQAGGTNGVEDGVPYCCVREGWDKRDNHVYTQIDGIDDCWAVEPFQPSYASTRFFPFFYFSTFEVDDQRFPQSLTQRGAKIQDEYCATRSSFRLARERSIPGIIVNAGAMADTEMDKINTSVRNEVIPLRLTDQSQDVRTLFAEKPVAKIDPRLYDTTMILSDWDRTSGVQEAQTGAQSQDKTATQSEIEQSGFSTRTTTSRDMIEATLSDLAQYTAEVALGCVKPDVAARIAGPHAFWPHGISVEDILTMVSVQISAGTTGKPKNRGDREAWGVIMPLIAEQQAQIAQLQLAPGQEGLVEAKKQLLTETMRRMGDDSDVERFLPKRPDPLQLLLNPPIPGAPAPGAPAPTSPATPQGGPLPGSSAPQPAPGAPNAPA